MLLRTALLLRRAVQNITILTGAGISAESGISTFRDENGLWCNHRVEDVAYPAAFESNPQLVQDFYNARRRQLLLDSVKPNAAHAALARLQREYKQGTVAIITQNVDNLHERAGSRGVLHMHGELLKVRCTETGIVYDWTRDIVRERDECACCHRLGTLRPHIVWFGEIPLYQDETAALLAATDLFVAIGSSGFVYPAAGFVEVAQQHGAKTLELNLQEGNNASLFDRAIYGKATEVVPKWVDEVLSAARDVEAAG